MLRGRTRACSTWWATRGRSTLTSEPLLAFFLVSQHALEVAETVPAAANLQTVLLLRWQLHAFVVVAQVRHDVGELLRHLLQADDLQAMNKLKKSFGCEFGGWRWDLHAGHSHDAGLEQCREALA